MNNFLLKINKKYIAAFLLVAIFFILDRFLKIFSLTYLFNTSLPLLSDWLTLTFSTNYFISFSLPLSGAWLWLLLIILISGLIIWFIKSCRTNQPPLLIISLGIIILGAFSNLLDRLLYGYVIDYLYLKNFTIFNLADVGISGGSLLALISLNKKPD